MKKGRLNDLGYWRAYKVMLSDARLEKRDFDLVFWFDQTTKTHRFNRSKLNKPCKRLQKKPVVRGDFLYRVTVSQYCLPF